MTGDRCLLCRGRGRMVPQGKGRADCNNCGARRVGSVWTWCIDYLPKPDQGALKG